MADVILVQMPYGAVERPALSLGLVSRYLCDAGLTVDVRYPNMDFAERIGLDVYQMVEKTRQEDFLGEWTFSGAAFPRFAPDHEAYFEEIAWTLNAGYPQLLDQFHGKLDLRALLFEVRSQAATFVDEEAERLVALGPRMIGCTSTFQQHCASLALLRRVKELDPSVLTIIGGANCEGPMGEATHRWFPWLDFVVSGDADAFIGTFCKDLLDEGANAAAVPLPPGVFGPASRKPKGLTVLGGGNGCGSNGDNGSGRAMVVDMDACAVPDYDAYFARLEAFSFRTFVRPGLIFETSRGCWWGEKHHCTFCGLNGDGMHFRSKTPQRVVDELDFLAERHDVTRFAAADNILDTAYVRSVLPRLAEKETPYSLFYEVKPNLRREQLEVLDAAGVRCIQPGIESMHDAILERLDKGNNTLINIRLLKWCLEIGIRIYWGLLYGVPGEEDGWYEEMADWLPLIHHLEPPGDGMHRIHYDRFSPYHFNAEKYGITLSPNRRYRFIYPVPEEALADLVYYFDDYTDLDRGAIDPKTEVNARPGLERAIDTVHQWRAWFWNAKVERPILQFEDDGSTIKIRDTRAVRVQDEHVLTGLDAALHRRLERGAAPAALLREVRKETPELTEEQVVRALDGLVDARLVLEQGGRYISLATPPPVKPLLPHTEIPHGMVSRAVVRDSTDTSLAKRFRKLDANPKLRDLFA